MQQQESYICECGKQYTNPQAFNGHKSHCKIHLTKTGRLQIREQVDKDNATKISLALSTRAHTEKQAAVELWIQEQHTCESCGVVMTSKWGSGRFCSASCSNRRQIDKETRIKINSALVGKSRDKVVITPEILEKREQARRLRYNEFPRHCVVCEAKLSYEQRQRKTCCNECKLKLLSKTSRESAARLGGNNNVHGVRGTAHYGTYAGFHCDSSYELAVVIYCLEHSIPIVRNTQGFDYEFNGEVHKYYPDFVIKDVYIETKNYWNEQVQSKIDQFPKHLKYSILYYEDIKPCIEYCVQKYGSRFTELYDRSYPSWSYPSWMDRNT